MDDAIPLVKHYRQAERELAAWAAQGGGDVSPARADMHVAGQLLGTPYAKLVAMTYRQYHPYAVSIGEATYPPQMRVEGRGPWQLTPCECCPTCGLLCTCGAECKDDCKGGDSITFRECMSEDFLASRPYGVADQYALVEMLAGEPIDGWQYRLYRTVSAAVTRSMTDPFWPVHKRE